MRQVDRSNSKLVDVHETARILHVPTSWIYQRTRPASERIPVVRLGKYVRFNPEEVVMFFKRRKGYHP